MPRVKRAIQASSESSKMRTRSSRSASIQNNNPKRNRRNRKSVVESDSDSQFEHSDSDLCLSIADSAVANSSSSGEEESKRRRGRPRRNEKRETRRRKDSIASSVASNSQKTYTTRSSCQKMPENEVQPRVPSVSPPPIVDREELFIHTPVNYAEGPNFAEITRHKNNPMLTTYLSATGDSTEEVIACSYAAAIWCSEAFDRSSDDTIDNAQMFVEKSLGFVRRKKEGQKRSASIQPVNRKSLIPLKIVLPIPLNSKVVAQFCRAERLLDSNNPVQPCHENYHDSLPKERSLFDDVQQAKSGFKMSSTKAERVKTSLETAFARF